MGMKKQLRITCDTLYCLASYNADTCDDQVRALSAVNEYGWVWAYNQHGLDVRCPEHIDDHQVPGGDRAVATIGNHR